MNIKFIKINDLNNSYAEQAFAIYRQSFSANERQKEEVLRQRLNLGKEELFAGLSDDEVISIGLIFNLSNSAFVLLDYVAVSPDARGTGIGTLFMEYLIQYCTQSNKPMILEVEDPDYGENHEERQRRVHFYRRLGAKSLQDVHYILPALDGTTTTMMILMMFAPENVSTMTRSEAEKLILDLYEQVYNRNIDDPLVLGVIRQLPETVKLL